MKKQMFRLRPIVFKKWVLHCLSQANFTSCFWNCQRLFYIHNSYASKSKKQNENDNKLITLPPFPSNCPLSTVNCLLKKGFRSPGSRRNGGNQMILEDLYRGKYAPIESIPTSAMWIRSLPMKTRKRSLPGTAMAKSQRQNRENDSLAAVSGRFQAGFAIGGEKA